MTIVRNVTRMRKTRSRERYKRRAVTSGVETTPVSLVGEGDQGVIKPKFITDFSLQQSFIVTIHSFFFFFIIVRIIFLILFFFRFYFLFFISFPKIPTFLPTFLFLSLLPFYHCLFPSTLSFLFCPSRSVLLFGTKTCLFLT